MAHTSFVGDRHVHDIIGVGFGPSNLALAIAIEEHNASRPDEAVVSGLFLERQELFGWHRGMLLEDATMQVCFLKDLVTLRNPASEFGFVSYLHCRDRLLDFINHKTLYPLRVEFHDYLEWAAAKVADVVRYGEDVTEVRPVVRDGVAVAFDVITAARGGRPAGAYRTRNLVLAMGLEPKVPIGVALGERVWHSHELLRRIAGLHHDPSRFVVVGAGQSAAEVTAHLHERFPQADVCAVFSRYGYSPADDSCFANRIFDPAAVDDFYLAPRGVKQAIVDYHSNTNYSVVDQDLIAELYGRTYRESVVGRRRLRLFNLSRLTDLSDSGNGLSATIESMATGERTVLDADVVVYATGYRPADPARILGDLTRYCRYDDDGRLCVDRDYRVATTPEVHAGIYLQGGTEHSHGLSSSLLSNTAVRAGEILESVVGRNRVVKAPHSALVVEHRVVGIDEAVALGRRSH